jgi:dTMP kinase
MLGKIITLEGIDGAGKSSFIDYVKKQLIAFDLFYAREPGSTDIGEKIRSLLLNQDMMPMTELLLYLAARHEAVNKVYIPHLMKSTNNVLLLDRFLDSSIIYQGIGRGFDVELIITLHKLTRSYLQPNLTLLFYCPLEIINQRKNQDNLDRIEQMGDDFFNKLQQSYLMLAQQNNNRIIVIDNSGSIEATQQQIAKALITIK